MQQPFNPPGSAAGDNDKALFASAVSSASQNKTVKAYVDLLLQSLNLKATSVVATQSVGFYQTIIDEAPGKLKAAQDLLDQVMAPLIAESEAADQGFNKFIDWVQQSAMFIANNEVGYQQKQMGVTVEGIRAQLNASNSQAGKALSAWLYGAPDKEAAYALVSLQALGKQTYFSGGPKLKELPQTNPPLLYKDKKISGVQALDNGVFGWRSKNTTWVFPDPGKLIKQATRLRYAGAYASQEPAVQGFFAARAWNSEFYPHVCKMAELWPAVDAALQQVQKIQDEFNTAMSKLPQSKINAAAASGQFKDALDAADAQYAFKGFLQGYVASLRKQVEAIASMDGLVLTAQGLLDLVGKQGSGISDTLDSANILYNKAGMETDASKSAPMMQQALAALKQAKASNDSALKSCADAQAALDKLSQVAQGLQTEQQTSGVSLPKAASDKVSGSISTATDLGNKVKDKQSALTAQGTQIDPAIARIPSLTGAPATNEPPPPPEPPKSNNTPLLVAGAIAALALLRK
jgi:hypothetical protein